MVKWTSSKGKLLAEQVKQALKSGTWGDIFAPDFDLDNFEMSDLKQSNPEWDASFSTKQFRENVGRMIGKMISDNDGADEEAADIGLGPRRRRGDGESFFCFSTAHSSFDLFSFSSSVFLSHFQALHPCLRKWTALLTTLTSATTPLL